MAPKKVSKKTREELVRAVGERYRASCQNEKKRILDEFIAVTEYHRKHAIRLLNTAGAPHHPRKSSAQGRVYDDAVKEAVVVLWEASDRICGKRLKPMLPVLVSALERHGHLNLDETILSKVLSASAATIDRILAPTKFAISGEGKKRPKALPGIRQSIPIRTFGDWKNPVPGYMEADLVAHCGGSMEGSFVHSFVLTDIASGWTECVALVVRSGSLVTEAMERLRTTMPFPFRGFDTDNGGEFINENVITYCTENGIEFTRSRPYKKNDQAWVEQKNGSIVRRLVGYRRLEGIVAAKALARLYAASRLFVNFFQPSFKLAEKKRVGAKVYKRYHSPQTPCARLLESDEVLDGMKDRLKEIALHLDPLQLLDEIRSAQCQLVRIADGDTSIIKQSPDANLEQFLGSLSTAWQQGEVRPTHRLKSKPSRNWRTRDDPFVAVWSKVCIWLETEPDRTARELFQRLQDEHQGHYPDGQLRTLQRRIKVWRTNAARNLVFGDAFKTDDSGKVIETKNEHTEIF